MKTFAVFLLSSLLAGALSAQTVWRCGPDGRSFQAVPCADGQAMALRAAPGSEAVSEAHAIAARERQALAQLRDERRDREQEAWQRGLGPAGIRPAALPAMEPVKPRKTSRTRPTKRHKETGGHGPAHRTFTASATRPPAD
jgi:hypothetical protein